MVRPAQVLPRLGPEARGIPISATRWGLRNRDHIMGDPNNSGNSSLTR